MKSHLEMDFPGDFCWELLFGKHIIRQSFKLSRNVEGKKVISKLELCL